MGLSKEEIYFQRLLYRLKQRCSDESTADVYKLSASVVLMEEFFSKLQDDKNIDSEVLMQYGREVHHLKVLVGAEQQKTAEERLRSIETLPRVFPSTDLRRRRGTSANDKSDDEGDDFGETCGLIKARAKSVYVADLRKQLLGATSKPGAVGVNGDLPTDKFVSQQEDMQEGLAEELLKLTYSLKDNISIAGNVIRADNQVLSSMQETAEGNRASLQVEGKRLDHYASRSWINCLMVGVVIFVIWVFLAMVLLIKFVPKN